MTRWVRGGVLDVGNVISGMTYRRSLCYLLGLLKDWPEYSKLAYRFSKKLLNVGGVDVLGSDDVSGP
jgi:hypothetical protein